MVHIAPGSMQPQVTLRAPLLIIFSLFKLFGHRQIFKYSCSPYLFYKGSVSFAMGEWRSINSVNSWIIFYIKHFYSNDSTRAFHSAELVLNMLWWYGNSTLPFCFLLLQNILNSYTL